MIKGVFEAVIVFIICVLVGCSGSGHRHARPHKKPKCEIDVDSIVKRGVLRVVTDYNSINYFVYKGIPVGYQYELLTEYCKSLGVKLDLVVSNDHDVNVDMLLDGKVDVIATSLIVDTILESSIKFTEPYGRSRQVLVQRTSESPDSVVNTIADMDGKQICVLANSFYSDYVSDLSTLHGDSIEVDPISDYDVEQLIQLVSEGEIDYAVSLENIALVNNWFYHNLDITCQISDEYDLAWGIRPNASRLEQDINAWMKKFKKTTKMKMMYRKYNVDHRDAESYSKSSVAADTYRGEFETIIKRECEGSQFHWLLVSSIVYQESRFNPTARSWAGAVGLMQLMPETAIRFGVDDATSPEQNIMAGVRFLKWIDQRFIKYVPSKEERLKFVLASYNVGLGHVMDAMRLAEKFGKDPQKWDGNVGLFLLNKSNPAYYTDDVVKHGYCRGSETYAYVRNVILRYKNYLSVKH